ncbi:MAG: lysine exporter LysO family protein [Emergencia sp.]|nr:lysine exporter LysO family protein [Emergencia sp.]
MADLALYLSMAVIGYFFGSKLRNHETLIRWTGRLQTFAIIILIFSMGMRMGANREVVENLNSIGLYALIMTISIILFSIITMTAVRKLMGIDRFGNLQSKADRGGMVQEMTSETEIKTEGDADEASSDNKMNFMTAIIVLCVAGGLLFGHFCIPHIFSDMEVFSNLINVMINAGLCVLLFFVGFDMGVDGTAMQHFRQVGVRVFLFPVAVMAGTLIGAVVCVPILSEISLQEALAVGGGFGWYTFAPGLIMEAGLVTASAICFMHNVMREFISILIVPLVAKKIGYLEAMAVPACSSMDVCLPIIERSTRSDIAIYSFISGVVQSAAVPIVVPLILRLG